MFVVVRFPLWTGFPVLGELGDQVPRSSSNVVEVVRMIIVWLHLASPDRGGHVSLLLASFFVF
jgi:hypothetical protein